MKILLLLYLRRIIVDYTINIKNNSYNKENKLNRIVDDYKVNIFKDSIIIVEDYTVIRIIIIRFVYRIIILILEKKNYKLYNL